MTTKETIAKPMDAAELMVAYNNIAGSINQLADRQDAVNGWAQRIEAQLRLVHETLKSIDQQLNELATK